MYFLEGGLCFSLWRVGIKNLLEVFGFHLCPKKTPMGLEDLVHQARDLSSASPMEARGFMIRFRSLSPLTFQPEALQSFTS